MAWGLVLSFSNFVVWVLGIMKIIYQSILNKIIVKMDTRFKINKREVYNPNRNSLISWNDAKKVLDANRKIKVSTLQAVGNETSRTCEESSKLPIKKSVSHGSGDIKKILKKTFKISNENKPKISDTKLAEIFQKKISHLNKLSPCPMSFPVVSNRFYQTLLKLEPKLSNYYLNIKTNKYIHG